MSIRGKKFLAGTLLLSLLLTASACNPDSDPEKAELTISAAASMRDALEKVGAAYEERNKGIRLLFNYGSSGALQQQIEQGAPVDLYISAALDNMNQLVMKGFIASDQQTHLLANELVMVVPADSQAELTQLSDLANSNRINVAIGIPETVPAGHYAKEALMGAQLWDKLQSRIVQAKDVRQVLQYVETGNADAGFIYKTDALASPKVKVKLIVSPAAYTPIVYAAGIVKSTPHKKETEDLYQYLQSQAAMDVFLRYGFSEPKRP